MEETLVVQVVPEAEHARLDAVNFVVSTVGRLLTSIDRALNRAYFRTPRQRGHTRHWVVRSMHASAPTFVLSSNGLRPPELQTTSELVIAAVRNLDGPEPVPPRPLAEETLNVISGLSKGLASHGLRAVGFDRRDPGNMPPIAVVDRETSKRMELVLGAAYEEFGYVEGVLDTVSVRSLPRFSITDAFTGRVIHCTVGEHQELLEQAKSALGSYVRVFGMVSFFPSGDPNKVTDVQEVEVYRLPDVSGTQLFGSLRDAPGLEDPVSSIRGFREAT
ncbi:MAG: hypothetical protein KatS3mg015_3208 [Fimbriimonadales bacterium]|nr:MAG: hypothetical protein KatS3mg015_3208 [Fimbriimonadales bacterium]